MKAFAHHSIVGLASDGAFCSFEIEFKLKIIHEGNGMRVEPKECNYQVCCGNIRVFSWSLFCALGPARGKSQTFDFFCLLL